MLYAFEKSRYDMKGFDLLRGRGYEPGRARANERGDVVLKPPMVPVYKGEATMQERKAATNNSQGGNKEKTKHKR